MDLNKTTIKNIYFNYIKKILTCFILILSLFSKNSYASSINVKEDDIVNICYNDKLYFKQKNITDVIIKDKLINDKNFLDLICLNIHSYNYYYDDYFYKQDMPDVNPVALTNDYSLFGGDLKRRFFLEYKKYYSNKKDNKLIGSVLAKQSGNRTKFFYDEVIDDSSKKDFLYLYDNKLALEKDDLDNLFGAYVFGVNQQTTVSNVYSDLVFSLYEETVMSMFYFAHVNKCINEKFNLDTKEKHSSNQDNIDISYLDNFTNNIYFSKYSESIDEDRDDIIIWATFIKSAIDYAIKNSYINSESISDVLKSVYFNDPSMFFEKEKDNYYLVNNYLAVNEMDLVSNNFNLEYYDTYDSIKIENPNIFLNKENKDNSAFQSFLQKNWPCRDGVFKGYCNGSYPADLSIAINKALDYYSILYLKYIKNDALKSGWKKDKFIYGEKFTCDYSNKRPYSSFLSSRMGLRDNLKSAIKNKFKILDKLLYDMSVLEQNIKLEEFNSIQKYALKVIEVNKQLDAIRIIDSRVKNESN